MQSTLFQAGKCADWGLGGHRDQGSNLNQGSPLFLSGSSVTSGSSSMQTMDTTLYPQGLVFFTSLYALVRIQFLWGPVEPSTVLTSELLINFCVGFRKKNVTIEKKK